MVGFTGCSSLTEVDDTEQSLTFAQYQREVVAHVQEHRKFQKMGEYELLWNSPQQWWPENLAEDKVPKKGILLVHGLGDSPYSFNDIAQEFASNGYLV
jgi:hypothetical protein